MAYQMSEGLAQNSADFIKKLRDFVITTTGWTSVQDTVLTTGASASYFAASSTGESGQDSNVIRFIRQNANGVTGLGYLSWAAGSGKVLAGSTATTAASGTYVTTDDNSPFWYWMFGSLDRIIVITQTGSRLGLSDAMYVGSYTRARSTQVATCTNAPAAGTSVTFSTTNTAFFTVGKRYTIADANNFESPKVTAISAGVSVTLDILNNSYAIGARLGEDPRPLLVTTQGSGLGLALGNWCVAPPMRASLAIAANTAALVQGEFVVRTVDQLLIERVGVPDGGPDGGGGLTANGLIDMWPLFLADESMFSGGNLGTLTECFVVPRVGVATDDTLTVGSSVYQVVQTAEANTATGPTAIALAVRKT